MQSFIASFEKARDTLDIPSEIDPGSFPCMLISTFTDKSDTLNVPSSNTVVTQSRVTVITLSFENEIRVIFMTDLGFNMII